MSLEAIAALLGHRSMRMTLTYARISDRTVAEEYFRVTEAVEAGYQSTAADASRRRGAQHAAPRRRSPAPARQRPLHPPRELDCTFESICERCGFFETGPSSCPSSASNGTTPPTTTRRTGAAVHEPPRRHRRRRLNRASMAVPRPGWITRVTTHAGEAERAGRPHSGADVLGHLGRAGSRRSGLGVRRRQRGTWPEHRASRPGLWEALGRLP